MGFAGAEIKDRPAILGFRFWFFLAHVATSTNELRFRPDNHKAIAASHGQYYKQIFLNA
jgi:hypothetical protein